MPIPTLWWNPSRLNRLLPAITNRIKHPKIAVILFSIISAENIKIFLIEGYGMIFDLRCLDDVVINLRFSI